MNCKHQNPKVLNPVEQIPGEHVQVCPQMLPESHMPPAAEEAYSPPSPAGLSEKMLDKRKKKRYLALVDNYSSPEGHLSNIIFVESV